MKKVLVISNVNAGRKKAVKYKREVRKFLFSNSDEFKFVNLDELENQDMNLFDTILVMGGDGTINKVLPYVGDRALGIIPCGTANLLAAKLGIPNNIKKVLRIIKAQNYIETDLIDINGNPCILRCGIGYDSNIICHTPQSLKNKFGYFAYFVAGILFALRLKNREYLIRINEEEKTVQSSCIIIANASNMYQNLFSVGNNSKLNDGLFEVFVLKTQNPIVFFIEFIRILFNIRTNSERASYFKTDNLYLKTNYFNFHIDGESFKDCNELNFVFRKEKIKIFQV